MKVAVTLSGGTPASPFDAHFGRAQWFGLVDSAGGDWTLLANPAREASGGAGVRAAQFLAGQGAVAVVTGSYGPKAWTTLRAAGIRPFLAAESAGLTGVEVLERLRAGTLTEAESASHDGHAGG
jgi:predicted Fe-Mo cluster-binding NifX family protein